MEVNADGLPKNFFFDKPLDSQTKQVLEDGDYIYYRFCTMILHEIGHYFGFKHGNEVGCNHDGSIMKESLEPYEDATDDVGGPLSEDDRCMFKKLYCCQESVTDVAEETSLESGVPDCLKIGSNENVTFTVL